MKRAARLLLEEGRGGIRRMRHLAEYDARPLTEQEVRVDLTHAREIVRTLTRELFPPKPR